MSEFQLPASLFHECLSPSDSSTAARVLARLVEAAGPLHVEGCDRLDIGEYESLGLCKTSELPVPAHVSVARWGGVDHDEVTVDTELGAWRVEWKDGEVLYAVDAQWNLGWDTVKRTWLVARTEQIAHEFLLDLERRTNEPRDAILVFHGSCWNRSRDLYRAVQQASFDDLILAKDLKTRIREDFRRFVDSRAAYEGVGLPWRRGALFLGPPGNGKTHCLRALVKELGVPALYVQSVKTRYETEEQNLKRVFERARQLRPCVLVLEDLDSLVNAQNRSYFLNQLDGFEKNVGLIVLATTNHPDRIDPAILDRPSRFDRKYTFELPAMTERSAYLELWRKKLDGRVVWSEALRDRIASESEGFSFAYLQELVISSLTHAVADATDFAELLPRECASLREQMSSILKREGELGSTLETEDDD